MFQPQRKFPGFDGSTVELARQRVERGAAFFNRHFPGWQDRIHGAGPLLYMESFDYCAAAIATRHLPTPSGKCRVSNHFTHGDLDRSYPEFNTIQMGCSGDEQVPCALLRLMWMEAALWIPPLPQVLQKENWSLRLRRYWRAYRDCFLE